MIELEEVELASREARVATLEQWVTTTQPPAPPEGDDGEGGWWRDEPAWPKLIAALGGIFQWFDIYKQDPEPFLSGCRFRRGMHCDLEPNAPVLLAAVETEKRIAVNILRAIYDALAELYHVDRDALLSDDGFALLPVGTALWRYHEAAAVGQPAEFTPEAEAVYRAEILRGHPMFDPDSVYQRHLKYWHDHLTDGLADEGMTHLLPLSAPGEAEMNVPESVFLSAKGT